MNMNRFEWQMTTIVDVGTSEINSSDFEVKRKLIICASVNNMILYSCERFPRTHSLN